jgi:hypothetical protein
VGQHNIIELNGKRYDAITGAVLGVATGHGAVRRSPRAIDGIVRASKISPQAQTRRPHASTPATQPVVAAIHTASSSKATNHKVDVSRPHISPVKHHQPQKGKTLMRRAVQKPDVTLKPAIKVQAPSEIAAASVKTVAKPLAKKLSVTNVNTARLARAETTVQSSSIRRFQSPASSAAKPRAAIAYHQSASSVPAHVSRPVAFTPLQHPISQATLPTNTPAKRPQTDIFEAAIAHATSHQQQAPRLHRKKQKMASVFAGVAAFLILGGFIAYLNLPGIEMQFASMKVGFRAELPEYAPTGYAMAGGIRSDGDGQISVSYRSGDSAYTIRQQQSDWNSQTLLESYVTANASDHQTIQSQGRTIYIYNGNNATWVDGGVRYNINGNAPLTANDIVKVASSM